MNHLASRILVMGIISLAPFSSYALASAAHHSPQVTKVAYGVDLRAPAVVVRPPAVVIRPPVVRPIVPVRAGPRRYRIGDVVRNLPPRALRVPPRALRAGRRGNGPFYVLRGRGGPTYFREAPRGFRVVPNPTR